MQIIGIVAEYNPFHRGHHHQISQLKAQFGEETAIVAVMSGNFVQRGEPALLDKWERAKLAIRGGADLILELPTLWAVSSAETFAQGAIDILLGTGIVNTLSFGCEEEDFSKLHKVAKFLSSEEFETSLQEYLSKGESYPKASVSALTAQHPDLAATLSSPNNLLGISYLSALEKRDAKLNIAPILRKGAPHDSDTPQETFASASYLRHTILNGTPEDALAYLPPACQDFLEAKDFARLSHCTRAILARLRTMTEEDYLALPLCTAGLHNKLRRAAQESTTLEELYQNAKARHITHARIRRMILWAFLNLKEEDRPPSPPYLRVLAMNSRGKILLKAMKDTASLPLITKAAHSYDIGGETQKVFLQEARSTDLYELCRDKFGEVANKREFSTNPVILD